MKKLILLVAAGLFPFTYVQAQTFSQSPDTLPQVQILGKHERNYFLAFVRANRPLSVERMLWESKAPQLLAGLPDDAGNTPLIIAAENGYFSIVRILLSPQYGVNVNSVNADNQTALCVAAKNKQVQAVKYLLAHPKINVDYECGPESERKTAFLIAAQNGAVPEILQALIDAHANALPREKRR